MLAFEQAIELVRCGAGLVIPANRYGFQQLLELVRSSGNAREIRITGADTALTFTQLQELARSGGGRVIFESR